MKYCLRYQKYNTKLMKKIDEILITYNKTDTTLLDFLEKYNDKRIIIAINDFNSFKETNEINIFKSIKEAYPQYNFVLRFSEIDEETLEIVKKYSIPFFMRKFVNDWDTFIGFINLGVSDIYIVETLGFEINKCGEIAHQNNINIRVFPNVAQSQYKNTPDIKKFFIRPEDTIEYESYVDVYEFICDIEQEETMYNIYNKDKKWFGELKEIIVGFNDDLDGRYIIPRFAQARISCGKKCLKNGLCNTCQTVKDLSNTLKEHDIVVYTDKIK